MVENSCFALTQTNSVEIQFPIHLLHNGNLKEKTGELTRGVGFHSDQFKYNATEQNRRKKAWLHNLGLIVFRTKK